MKTLATMGIEVWHDRGRSVKDPKVDELIYFIQKALKIDQSQLVTAMVHADFNLSDVLVSPQLKSKLLQFLV